jgi:hypothetical protein
MTLSAHATGTQTATGGGVEDFLSSPNVAGTFQLYVDTNAMVAGDVLELKVYCMVLTGGTQRVAYYQRYEGAQPTNDLIKVSVPISTELAETNGLRFSLTQSGAGTDKNYPWKLLRWT